MLDERGHLFPVESGAFVLATYREIAAHFRLSGPNAARTKAKRAGWRAQPTNHPADPLRIGVPRDVWSQAAETPFPQRPARLGHTADGGPGSQASATPTGNRREIPPLRGGDGASQMADARYLRALEGHINTLREDVAVERAARIAAEGQRDQAFTDLRLEREQRATEAARLQAELDHARADSLAERSRADQADQAVIGERTRADGLRNQLEAMRVQLATSEAEVKAAHDRAGALGEQQAAAERQANTERARADRAEAQAAHEREDFLNADGRTRLELETVREQFAVAEALQDRLRAEIDSAHAKLAEARRAADERKGRGRWARLRAAWLGE
jgi:hypothetical protein